MHGKRFLKEAQMFLSLNLHRFVHQSKPEEVVVSYLVFIKLHSTSSQEYSDIAVPVLTSRGLLCPAKERVHFSVEYGNIDLPERLPGKEKPAFPERNPASATFEDMTWAHNHFLEASSNLTQQPYLPSVEVLIRLITIFGCLYLGKYTKLLLFLLNFNPFSLYP